MELSFDERGNLKPYDVIEISVKRFEKTFVNSFDTESTRHQLYENYKIYMAELSKLISKGFYQLVDGSFISNKENPRDIDFVTVMDFRDYETHKKILESEFASFAGRSK